MDNWLKVEAQTTIDIWNEQALELSDKATSCRIAKFRGEYLRLALKAKTLGLIFHDKYVDMYYDLIEAKRNDL